MSTFLVGILSVKQTAVEFRMKILPKNTLKFFTEYNYFYPKIVPNENWKNHLRRKKYICTMHIHTYIKNQLLRYMIVTKDTQYGLTCDMTVAFLFLHQELSILWFWHDNINKDLLSWRAWMALVKIQIDSQIIKSVVFI